MILCWRTFLVAGFVPVFDPRVLAGKDWALEVHTFA